MNIPTQAKPGLDWARSTPRAFLNGGHARVGMFHPGSKRLASVAEKIDSLVAARTTRGAPERTRRGFVREAQGQVGMVSAARDTGKHWAAAGRPLIVS